METVRRRRRRGGGRGGGGGGGGLWGYSGGTEGYNEGTMYPYSLPSQKEEGKWIKIYVKLRRRGNA